MKKIKLQAEDKVLYCYFVAPVAPRKTQSADQFRIRLISQLIKDISRVLQKLLQCFYGAAISKSFVLPARGFCTVILIVDLIDSEFLKVAFGSSA